MSAIFLADAHQTRLIGVTKQLIGKTRWHAPPFGYCGSIGPVALRETIDRRLRGIGELLGDGFSLRGLFGVDFLLSNDAVRGAGIRNRAVTCGSACAGVHFRAGVCRSRPAQLAVIGGDYWKSNSVCCG